MVDNEEEILQCMKALGDSRNLFSQFRIKANKIKEGVALDDLEIEQ